MRSQRCETCRFFEDDYCHRRPPKTIYEPDKFHVLFDRTHRTMWCGEWKLAWRQFFKLFNRKDQP